MSERASERVLLTYRALADEELAPEEHLLKTMAAEIDEHRAMVKRLEKFAADLEGHGLISTGDFIAAELRNRMRTP